MFGRVTRNKQCKIWHLKSEAFRNAFWKWVQFILNREYYPRPYKRLLEEVVVYFFLVMRHMFKKHVLLLYANICIDNTSPHSLMLLSRKEHTPGFGCSSLIKWWLYNFQPAEARTFFFTVYLCYWYPHVNTGHHCWGTWYRFTYRCSMLIRPNTRTTCLGKVFKGKYCHDVYLQTHSIYILIYTNIYITWIGSSPSKPTTFIFYNPDTFLLYPHLML